MSQPQPTRRQTISTGVYAAQSGGAGALGVLAGIWYGRLVPGAGPEEIAAVGVLAMWLITVGVKTIRDWRFDTRSASTQVLLIFLTLLALGCATGGAESTETRPVVKKTVLDGKGNITDRLEVSVAGNLVGQGCVAYDISPEGTVAFVLSQYGTSDWSTVRGLVSIVPETVALALNPVSTPIDALIKALSGRPPMDRPMLLENPCAVLFEPSVKPAPQE